MKELESIVQRMMDAGESESKIREAVRIYKQNQKGKAKDSTVDPTMSQDDMGSRLDDGSSEPVSWFDQTWFGRGVAAASTTGEATDLMAQDFSNIDMESIQEFMKAKESEAKTHVPSERMEKFQKKYKEEGSTWSAFFRGVKDQPGLLPELFVQSLGTQVGTLIDSPGASLAAAGAGAAGGAAVAAVPGAVAGFMGGLATSMEAALTFGELLETELKEEGKEFTDENIKALLEGPKGNSIRNRAIGRGLTIGAVEGLSGGVAGKAAVATRKAVATVKGAKTTAIAAGAAGVAVEGVGGGVGEVLGRVAADQEMDAAEIGFEAITGTTTAPINILTALKSAKQPTYSLNGVDVTYKEMKDFVETADDIDVAKAKIKIEDDFTGVGTLAAKKQNKAIVDSQIDDKITDKKDRDTLIELNDKRIEAEANVKKKGIDKVPNAPEELATIQAEIDAIIGKYEGAMGIGETQKAQDVAKVVRENRISDTIAFAETQGQRIGKQTIVVDNNEQAQAAHDKIAKEMGLKAQDVTNADGFIVGDSIIINKDVAGRTGAINVGAHEVLHGVLAKHMQSLVKDIKDKDGNVIGQDKSEVKKLISSFKNVLSKKQLAAVTTRLQDNYKDQIAADPEFMETTEEWFTAFSDAIEQNEIAFDEGVFGKIKNTIQEILRKFGIKKDFADGRQAYNFLKDYSKSIKKNKLSSRAMALAGEGATVTEGKFSKTASDKVQSIYEEQGVAGAMDIIEQFKPIVSRIAERRREAPNFDRELLMSEIEIGERGIFDLISKYDPDSGVPLAAYINKFLPSRAIEASRRVLGEEFTEDVSERVDIAAEEVAEVEVKAKPEKKKIVLADRLGVTEEVAKAIKKLMPKVDFNKETFKSLKNQVPEITGEMFGISPKKLISGANITKKELQSAQMFINKNADVLISMLPEGATAGGTATGVPQTLLKAFYTKTDRAKMAKTGTKAGLAIQVKNDINKTDFLETFGIIDGKPDRTDRNTSARVLALANQTGKMMTNQAVRQSLISSGKTVGEVTSLSDGKAKVMFSITGKKKVTSPIKSASQKIADEIGNKATYDNMVRAAGIDIDTGELKLKPIDLATEQGRQEYVGFITEVLVPVFPKNVLLAMSGSFARGDSSIEKANKNKFVFQNKEQFEIFLETLEATGVVFGENMTVENQNDMLNAVKREGYGKATSKTQNKKMSDKELKASKKRGFKLIWQMIQDNIQNDQRTIPGFALMLSSSSRFQGHFTRTGAVIDFINTLTGKNREEHTSPITALGKYLFLHAVTGDLFTGGKNSIFENATKSYFQGSLPVFMDDRLKLKGVYNYSSLPPIEHLEGILKGDISIWARYFHPNVNNNFTTDFDSMSAQDIANGEHLIGGINPNVIKLANGNTIAQEFGVDVNVKITPQIAAAQQGLIYRIAIGEKINASKIKSVLNTAINLKIKPQLKETKTLNKSIAFSRSANNPTKGITVLDFDDTLATSKSLVISTSPDGTVRKLTAEEFAQEGADLLDQGWTHDFSEFSKVVDGKVASLFKKAMKLQGKFGPENMFVLTARPADSAPAIFEFLKANGLNIPLKNITGLANSTAESKALWMAEKVGEGYNDFYFADDALQNVQAVKNMLDQFDVKSKVQQAKVKFSKSMNDQFNDILENVTGIESDKRFSIIKGRKRGEGKGKFRVFIPPSHEDFVGLLYNFLGKGKEGNAHRDFFEQALIRPLNRANREFDTARQSVANDYKELNKQFEDVRKKLTKKTADGDFTFQDAIRVYLWDKHGHKIPGLSETDQAKLAELVMSDPQLQAYAETLNVISKQETYVNPTDGWNGGDIRMDLDDATGRIGRKQFFSEFIENADVIFSEENLNKIEAGYGKEVRESLEDMLYRIQTGRNRPTGQNAQVNKLMNYLNGSVGTVMFFNMRSALLQQMSIVNYINFADNNIFAAAKAFANQKQYWKDFAFIFNSDMLKQRRGGIQTDVNGAELAASLRNSKDITRKLISKLLELGFLPTQIGDNIAIATGGAAYYRNRINKYIKQGMSQKEAEAAAFTDFQDITQSTQQSARPDMVSKQQASVIGKVILNFQNVTSQFNRLGKKAFQDIYNRRITKPNSTQMQSDISNAARITYYFAIQNAIFYTLQTALFAMMFDDDEEDNNKLFLKKKERLINGSIDSVLRGSGLIGGVVATLKNVAIAFARQRDAKYNPDESAVLLEALNLSPVLGIKGRKITNAEKTLNYNKKVIDEMETFDIDNPQWSSATNYTEALTNIPLNRLYNKTQNVRQALNNDHSAWERSLMFLGWSQYNLDLENKKMEEIKEKTKSKKKKKKNTNSRDMKVIVR